MSNGTIRFSALQRAEIAEIPQRKPKRTTGTERFSALQRAEIAEIFDRQMQLLRQPDVSVLFNEPKLLKW